jgi:hypothetical protein
MAEQISSAFLGYATINWVDAEEGGVDYGAGPIFENRSMNRRFFSNHEYRTMEYQHMMGHYNQLSHEPRLHFVVLVPRNLIRDISSLGQDVQQSRYPRVDWTPPLQAIPYGIERSQIYLIDGSRRVSVSDSLGRYALERCLDPKQLTDRLGDWHCVLYDYGNASSV